MVPFATACPSLLYFMQITVAQLSELLQGSFTGEGSFELQGFAHAENAEPGDLTFADTEAFFLSAEASRASAILVDKPFVSETKTVIQVANTRTAVTRLLPLFFPPEAYAPGIHPSAVVAASAVIDPSAHLGPNVVIGEKVRIGARTALLGGNQVGAGSAIGEDCVLHPSVILYPHSKLGNRVHLHAGTVIGADGFGYSFSQGRHQKVLQVGNVVIGNDVEIGANAAIDRGALGSTVVGDGTKVDNFVHLAHNVKIGKHCLLLGQVGVAGSTEVGDYTVIASQTGIAGHLKIGSQVTIGAKSGIMRDVPDQSKILGVPAVPDKQAKRQWLGIQKLPEILSRLREVEKRLGEEPALPMD